MNYKSTGNNNLTAVTLFMSFKKQFVNRQYWFRFLGAVLLGIILFVPRTNAQDVDSSAVKLLTALKDNSYPLRLADGKLEGQGGIWLRKHAEKATIVALGEEHATREIPSIMSALIRDLKEHDEFDHLALEVSPWTAQLMTDSLRKGKKAYDSLIRKYPPSIPFYNFKNERNLVYRAVKNSDSNRPLWGLDQVFLFSTQMAFDRLKELADSKKARTAVQKVETSADSARAVNPDLQNLPSAIPKPITFFNRKDLKSLKNYFEGDDEALNILSELSKSIKIYRTNYSDNYASNQIRARYMRDNLRNDFQQARKTSEKTPKVVIKIGAAHVYKGFTPNDALDVGNLSVSLAQSVGGRAFNVAILCGPGAKSRRFPSKVSKCYRGGFGKVFKSIVGNQITLFDLTALHPMLHKGTIKASSRIEKFLWAFDAVILVPDTQPARYITPITK